MMLPDTTPDFDTVEATAAFVDLAGYSIPFAIVRNPIFTTLLLTLTGLTLMVPNPIAIAGLLIAIAGIQLQVREVEEPYLRRVHGHTYRDYTTRVGRFLPWLGRTRDETNDAARHYT